MINLFFNGAAYSPIKMPNLNCAIYPGVYYHHHAKRKSPTELDLSITVTLNVHEDKSGKIHKIMNTTSRFTFEVIETKLTMEALIKAWEKSFDNMYLAFVKTLFEIGMPKMPISGPTIEKLNDTIQPILTMFNDTPYVPDK